MTPRLVATSRPVSFSQIWASRVILAVPMAATFVPITSVSLRKAGDRKEICRSARISGKLEMASPPIAARYSNRPFSKYVA